MRKLTLGEKILDRLPYDQRREILSALAGSGEISHEAAGVLASQASLRANAAEVAKRMEARPVAVRNLDGSLRSFRRVLPQAQRGEPYADYLERALLAFADELDRRAPSDA